MPDRRRLSTVGLKTLRIVFLSFIFLIPGKAWMSEAGQSIDEVGNLFSAWANANHVQIKIDGADLLGFTPSTGGWDKVYWDQSADVKKEFQATHKKETDKRRKRLKDLIQSHGCDENQILTSARQLVTRKKNGNSIEIASHVSPETFVDMFSCLGRVEVMKLTWSSD